MKPLAFASPLVLALTLSTAADADPDPDPAPPVTQGRDYAASEEVLVTGAMSARAMANDWIVPDHGWQLGSSLSYLMSSGGIGEHGLAFTDVVLARLSARAAVLGRAEIYGGVDLLPKQPSFTDELVYQGAHAGFLFALPHHLALDAQVAEGELLEQAGEYGSAHVGLVGRHRVEDFLVYQGEVEAGWTPLRWDGGTSHAWLAEVSATGSLVFRVPNGMAAAWAGFSFAFPIAHAGALPGVGELDPQVRSDVRIGGVLSAIKAWDIYAELAVIDRGDYTAPRTMLPILDGGFDQRQLTIGIVRHFGLDRAVDVPSELGLASTGSSSARVAR